MANCHVDSSGDVGEPLSTIVSGHWTTRVATFDWPVNDAAAREQARRARLARWQQGTGNERDEQRRARQTAAARAQDARSASDPRNSSAA